MAEQSTATVSDSAIATLFAATRDPFTVFEARGASVDSLVIEASKHHLSSLSVPYALVAVGGYGRNELFPHSDVDLLLAFDSESDLAGAKEAFGEFIRVLWDSELKVSQSARTIAECCRLNEQNIELHVSLLDLRFLAGDRDLFNKLSEQIAGFNKRHAAGISGRLTAMCRERHAKFQNTAFHLEPNVKDSPGGIRDIHVLHWLALLSPEKEPFRDSLAECGPLRSFLYQLRCFLHFESGRDSNLLTFELQDRAAQTLPPSPLTAEEYMRQYYWHTRSILASTRRSLDFAESQDTSLLRQFRDWRQRLSTADLTVSHERVFLRNPALTVQSAESTLAVFTFVARHGIPLSWDAQRRLRANAGALSAASQSRPPSWPQWRELFVQPNVALALHAMEDTAALTALLSEWWFIDGLVVRDFYHRYTVDEHTLVAIDAIDRLIANQPRTPPRIRELAHSDEDRIIVRLALLLHDIGKGTHPGDHILGSVETAGQVLPRLGAPEIVRSAVLFLIERHLELSHVMNGRDLSDPATARYLTSRISTQEDLRRLVLLTYADISAVNPSAMTPWRLEQLWRVYTLASEQLTRELTASRIHQGSDSPVLSFAEPEVNEFIEGFPTRYLRTHNRDDIRTHFTLEQTRQRDGVAVNITRGNGVFTATVLAGDHPGLFASLCGALAGFGMNILQAEAYSNRNRIALDIFRFSDPLHTLELNPSETARLEWTISCVVKEVIPVDDLLKRRPRVKPSAPADRIHPVVRFNNESSDSSTLLEFIGEDRPGLLYDLSSTLARASCDIELVLADTEGRKAVDVLYITKDKAKLDTATQQILITKLCGAGGSLRADGLIGPS